MKDRMGNKLAVGQKVMVVLPESNIFGFVSDVEDGGVVGVVSGGRRELERKPGRLLVSCVIAIPIEAGSEMAGAVVRVVDPDKHEVEPEQERPN